MFDFFSHTVAIRVAIDLGGLAVSGALLVVPSFTALQSWARRDHRARVVAGANILNAAFIFFSGIAVAAFQAVGLSASHVFTTLAVANIVVAWLMVRYMPTNALWDLVNILFRTFSRLEVEGRENLEKAGKSPILAFNHVSFSGRASGHGHHRGRADFCYRCQNGQDLVDASLYELLQISRAGAFPAHCDGSRRRCPAEAAILLSSFLRGAFRRRVA